MPLNQKSTTNHFQPYQRPTPFLDFSGRLVNRITRTWLEEKPLLLLKPLSSIYGLATTLRRLLYPYFSQTAQAGKPVISLGNLTVGGTGKTPLCLTIARLLLELHFRPAILSRGYKRQNSQTATSTIVSRGHGPTLEVADSGDEPWLMAAELPEARVVVDSDRRRAAITAVDNLDANILILDDAFQYLALKTDCRLLLLPAFRPFGNGALLPSGPLREPIAAHRLAQILVNTGTDEPTPEALTLAAGRPLFTAAYHFSSWRYLSQNELKPPESLAGRKVFAFCGLARPDSFKQSLLSLGIELKDFLSLPDHQIYNRSLLNDLGLAFLASGAEFIVTTTKDAVKIPPTFPLPVLIPKTEMRINRADDFIKTIFDILKKSQAL
ncbi:MAG: hypothetical protein AMR96_05060 [Candidatus Adiutrix intracellularis]|nr:MAG: hypothetical protein AMR96_05060 [Candidatus Adiutrix intracellularis]